MQIFSNADVYKKDDSNFVMYQYFFLFCQSNIVELDYRLDFPQRSSRVVLEKYYKSNTFQSLILENREILNNLN